MSWGFVAANAKASWARKRQRTKIFQPEAARRLKVSTVTLSHWECDKVFPTAPYQARIIEYLGYNPFSHPDEFDPENTESNESSGVAFLRLG
jgi:transcriptional regulator with XRE-family HTH domain